MSTTDGELRIGDAEREHVRGRLERHAADGRLTLDELAERMGEVYAARTAGELRRAQRELPPLPGDGPGPGLPMALRPGGAAVRRRPGRPAPVLAVALLAVWIVVAASTGFWFFPFWPLLFFAAAGRRGGWGPGGWGGHRRGGWDRSPDATRYV